MNCVFTIVSKNYIPLANILADSVMNNNENISLFIVVVDEEDGVINFSQQRYKIVKASSLSIKNYEQLAFKYNVTEFCTAIKPYAFSYFLKNYENVIYFDPDIYVFSNLGLIFENLKKNSLILTPHFCTPESQYTGIFREGNILFAGIFNLGFIGMRSDNNTEKILMWWENRLEHLCYADRTDGFHVDQKWADFFPTLFDGISIEKNLGLNVAIWNWHERELLNINNTYYVRNRINGGDLYPLIFFHFSNYNFRQADNLQKFLPTNSNRFLDIIEVSKFYSLKLLNQNINENLVKLSYTYAKFNNGHYILNWHRRLYRRLLERGLSNESSPFDTQSEQSLFRLFSEHKLISSNNVDKLNETNFEGFSKKISFIHKISKILCKVIGFDKYILLCKFAFRFVRPENHTHLLGFKNEDIPFINENRYINE